MNARRRRLADARLYLVSPARMAAGRLAAHMPALAAAGVDIVQLRDRSLAPDALHAEAAACAEAASAAGILFIVNDDPVLARAIGADGVHIGQDDGTVEDARRILGPDRVVGRSTRGGEMLATAVQEGADYAAVGPVWATPTKPGRPAVGVGAVAAAAAAGAPIPWFAIGGIDARRVGRIAALGARRCVVVRAITDAPDPAAAARTLRERLVGGMPRILSVAGSDSGGGAGIQADIKAIAALGGYPMTAVTAITAQNTSGVSAVHPIPPDIVARQIADVAADIGLDAVKTGMLGDAALIEAVAAALADARRDDERIPLVVDPVMVATSGAHLLDDGGRRALAARLLPSATVVTPNLMEARVIAGLPGAGAEDLARRIHHDHGCAVIVTGGHGDRTADVLCDDSGVEIIPGPRLDRLTTHGSGCTHAAALATLLGGGLSLRAAAARAKAVATAAVLEGRPFGAGQGPVDVVAGVAR